MEQQIHGGNIYDKNIYNKEITLDYSVNINPLGMPQEVCNAITQDIGGYQTYPDIKYTALRNAIAAKRVLMQITFIRLILMLGIYSVVMVLQNL